jgi:AraC family transcriptional regulator
MHPEIEIIEEKKLLGMSQQMSLAANTTFGLFSKFMPRSKEISGRLSTFIFDLRVYPQDYFIKFNPEKLFAKWALIEVEDFHHVPKDMECFTLEAGKYAVFTQKGKSADFELFHYIFTEWLPNSEYMLDDRPHFEKLEGNKDKNDTDKSELIYIPISDKDQ